jgi:hypothetical protein
MDEHAFQHKDTQHDQEPRMVSRFRWSGTRKSAFGVVAQPLLDDCNRSRRAGPAAIGLYRLGVYRLIVGSSLESDRVFNFVTNWDRDQVLRHDRRQVTTRMKTQCIMRC